MEKSGTRLLRSLLALAVLTVACGTAPATVPSPKSPPALATTAAVTTAPPSRPPATTTNAVPGEPEQMLVVGDFDNGSEASLRVAEAMSRQPYSRSLHGDTGPVKERWVAVFEQAAVDLVLSGHDHDSQRFEAGGVEYVVTGGGGAGLYELDDCPAGHPARLSGVERHHFLVITQDATGLHVSVVGGDGEVLDSFGVEG